MLNKGYVLTWQVEPSGPLANLKRFFSGKGMDSFKEWLTTYWYVVLAAGLLLLVLMVRTFLLIFYIYCEGLVTRAVKVAVFSHRFKIG